MNGFPRYKKGLIREVVLDFQSQPKVTSSESYEFLNKGGTAGIVLAPDSIALQVTEYSSFEDFTEKLCLVLKLVHEKLNIVLAERVGLRYVNVIKMEAGQGLGKYLRSGLIGFEDHTLGVMESQRFFQYNGRTEVGTLVARFSEQVGRMLPPDISAPNLQFGSNVEQSDKVPILDFDHFSGDPMDFAVEPLLDLFWDLHNTLDLVFRSSVTPEALQKWGNNNVGAANSANSV